MTAEIVLASIDALLHYCITLAKCHVKLRHSLQLEWKPCLFSVLLTSSPSIHLFFKLSHMPHLPEA